MIGNNNIILRYVKLSLNLNPKNTFKSRNDGSSMIMEFDSWYIFQDLCYFLYDILPEKLASHFVT